MKSKVMRLRSVLFLAVAMAVVATPAYSVMGRGSVTGGPGSSMGSGGDQHRSMGMGGSFRFDNGSRFGGSHDFDRDAGRRFRDRHDFDRDRFIFGFGIPFYYRPFYGYTPYSYFPPAYYDQGYYGNGYAYPSALVYLTDDLGAIWLSPTTLEVAWMGENPSLERMDYSLSDTYRREITHISCYNPPFRASLVVPNGAAYVTVRALGRGGLVVNEVTSPLPGRY